MSEDYRVQLDIYNGPIDLLLYLIRKDEVDIYDIPISRITDQYLKYVDLLHDLEPNLAGEFLVMAATLMEIKSRMLLPTDAVDEETGEPIDPRSELVRQLLQYKQFKDAASWLGDAGENQSLKYPRVPVLPKLNQGEVDIANLHIWDLVEAFSNLLQATLAGVGLHEVEKDDTPLALHQEDIMDRIRREGAMPFSRIFAGKTRRTEIIGLFLAMLELIRVGSIRIEQDEAFAEIYLFPQENSLETNDANYRYRDDEPLDEKTADVNHEIIDDVTDEISDEMPNEQIDTSIADFDLGDEIN